MERDKLEKMFDMQDAFMRCLAEKHPDYPQEWPFDITKKDNQLECKKLAFDSMGELFEAVQELKNSKKHRLTDITEFDRDKFLEELVDAFKYFLEILIFAGVTPHEFFEAYEKKDVIINERVKLGY